MTTWPSASHIVAVMIALWSFSCTSREPAATVDPDVAAVTDASPALRGKIERTSYESPIQNFTCDLSRMGAVDLSLDESYSANGGGSFVHFHDERGHFRQIHFEAMPADIRDEMLVRKNEIYPVFLNDIELKDYRTRFADAAVIHKESGRFAERDGYFAVVKLAPDKYAGLFFFFTPDFIYTLKFASDAKIAARLALNPSLKPADEAVTLLKSELQNLLSACEFTK